METVLVSLSVCTSVTENHERAVIKTFFFLIKVPKGFWEEGIKQEMELSSGNPESVFGI